MPTRPIGIFDSGVGGLSVMKEIRRALPGETLIYVADSGNAPYGDKPVSFIEERSLAVGSLLAERNVKAIVVACNTATGAAIAALRGRFSFPIVGIEPALKPAVKLSRAGVVGVMATHGTIGSRKFADLLARFGIGAQVAVQACPGLAERVEAGDLSGPVTRAMVRSYVQPLLDRGADIIVLGCTHYPFLAPLIREVAGDGVTVLEPSPAVARELRRRLETNGSLADAEAGDEIFLTTGLPERVAPVLSSLWGSPVTVSAVS